MAAESAQEFEALEAQAATLLESFKRAGYERVAPSIIQREDVTVAISTAGTSPALARRLRERVSDHETCQCMRWADLGPTLADVRTDIRARNLPVTPNEWQEVMTEELLEVFESGEHDRARRMLIQGLEAKAAAKASS